MLSRVKSKHFCSFKQVKYLCKQQNYKLCTKMDGVKVKAEVKQGVIVGQRRFTPNGSEFNSFLGVPYALPPLGKLRFKSPEPIERYDVAELDCTKHRAVSHQRDAFTQEVVGSEDCLFLNIYVPQGKEYQQPLPVMVWIHGGGFWFGNGNSDNFYPTSLLEEDVIIVTLNYRLGALGFLYLPQEGIWGNAGLKDQRLALQWIHENIDRFNGDPCNVCLFGESAGAAAVHLHCYASHSKVLFHKAIMQSGTANMEWVFQQNPAYKTRRLAELLGCSSNSSAEVLKFLQSEHVKPIDILANTLKVLTPDERRRGLPLAFKPVVEDNDSPDSFVNLTISEALQKPNKLNMPTIMGYNSAEGIAMVFNAIRKLPQCDEDLARFVPRNLPLSLDGLEIQELVKKMRDFYLNGQKLTHELLNGLTDMLSDYHFTVDMQKAAELQVRFQPNSPLYFYRFDYVGGRNLYKRFLQLEHLKGASHGDELFYLFQNATDDSQLAPADAEIIKKICKLFTNFAKCNNPSKTDTEDCLWTPVEHPKSNSHKFILNYLAIGNNCEMNVNPDKERIEFWRNIYQTYPAMDYSDRFHKGKL